MTLENLLAIHRLQAFEAAPGGVQRLLASAERNLADARLAGLSADNRFDAAYKTVIQCAMIGLLAKGFRTYTSQPGHHQTALQTLPKTLGLAADTVIVLDALRKQRNLNDYEGDPLPTRPSPNAWRKPKHSSPTPGNGWPAIAPTCSPKTLKPHARHRHQTPY